MQLSGKGMDTLNKLEGKAHSDKLRMPPIDRIHDLLNELNIPHEFRTNTNVVEYKSKGRNYVNSRHDGKKGYLLEYKSANQNEATELDTWTISLDTSDSYYSWNSYRYAQQLIKLINLKTQTQ